MSPRSAMCSLSCTAQEDLRTQLGKCPLTPHLRLEEPIRPRIAAAAVAQPVEYRNAILAADHDLASIRQERQARAATAAAM